MSEAREKALPFEVLGVRVDPVQIPEVVRQMEQWIGERNGCCGIAVTGMHGVTEARRSPAFKTILHEADLVVADGMPLVWLGRMRGRRMERRVYGPELMQAFCQQTGAKGYRHYFYGGAPGVPERLAEKFKKKYAEFVVAGMYSPPFRVLTAEEDEAAVAAINRAAPDVLWVGLGTPKQETWMHEHRSRLRVPVVVAVGAAFDINAGMKKQAPRWMRENGWEWLFRLGQEPRRLWRRYLVYGTQFVFFVGWETVSDWLFSRHRSESRDRAGN